jgi:hypothetical protein
MIAEPMGEPGTLVDDRRLLVEQRPGNDADAGIDGGQRIEFGIALRAYLILAGGMAPIRIVMLAIGGC